MRTTIHAIFGTLIWLSTLLATILTIWGMAAEWGLVGLVAGILMVPLSYVLIPFYSFLEYGSPDLFLTNFVIPAVCMAIAYWTQPREILAA